MPILVSSLTLLLLQLIIKMKKLKKQRSNTNKPKPHKPANDPKAPMSSKKNLLSKKHNESHKENKSMLQEASSLLKAPSKKPPTRSKIRSKSLIYDRKCPETSLDTSSRQALMEILQKKIDKADTDISAHLNSVKYDKHIYDVDKMYSNFLSPHNHREEPIRQCFSAAKHQNDTTPKLKLLLQENQTLRTNLTAIKEEIDTYQKEKQEAKQENQALKGKITEFQCEAQAQALIYQQRQQQLLQAHKIEKEKLENRVLDLQSQQHRLMQEKSTLESLVKNQQQNIFHLQKEKTELQMQCEIERRQKAMLKNDKEQAAIRIKSLEQELQYFETNLKQFQQIKQTYEEKLVLLEKEKRKIKRNAFQLLEMVQNYREC